MSQLIDFLRYVDLITIYQRSQFGRYVHNIAKYVVVFNNTVTKMNAYFNMNLILRISFPIKYLEFLLYFYGRLQGLFGLKKIGHNRIAQDLNLLEVRESNLKAKALYQKLGFFEVKRRRRYYEDGEDAIVMTLDLEDVL